MSKRILVERHPLAYRVLHWLIVSEMAVLLFTGFNVSETLNLGLLTRGFARSLHLVVAFAWLATITIFLYVFIISGEYRWFGFRRIGEGLDALVEKVRAFILGEREPEPVLYDPERGDYIEKIYPTEVLAWWIWATVWTILALTGLGLVFPEWFGWVNRFWSFVFPGFAEATAASRLAHLLGGIMVIVVVLVHGYMVIQTDMWRGIITGKRAEPVVERR
jgi:formate dehydrogenase subunit gamma